MNNNDDDQKHYGWRDGMPTRPDVDALMKKWPEPAVGDRFEYRAVEDEIGVPAKSARFKTITDMWRKRMQEKGVVIECDRGRSFYVASVDQITAGTYDALRSASRKLRKQRKKLSTAIPGTDEQRITVAHQGRLLHQHEMELRKARMNTLPSTVAPQSPRIAPPKKSEV